MKKIYIKLVTGIILIHCFYHGCASVNLDEKDNQKIFNSQKSELKYSIVHSNKVTMNENEEKSKFDSQSSENISKENGINNSSSIKVPDNTNDGILATYIFRLLSQNQLKEAVEFLENISKENKKVDLYDWFARSLFKFKFYDSAIEYFNKITTLSEISELRVFEASVNKAICKSFLGYYAMAVIDLRNLFAKKNSIPVDILFDIYMKAEEFTAKVTDLEKEYFYFIPSISDSIEQTIETENFGKSYPSTSSFSKSSKRLLEPYITIEQVENSKKKRFLSLNLDGSSEYIYFD